MNAELLYGYWGGYEMKKYNIVFLLFIVIFIVGCTEKSMVGTNKEIKDNCYDNIDNDNDLKIDFEDEDCISEAQKDAIVK